MFTASRYELPPQNKGVPWGSLLLAFVAHALLVAILAAGVAWKRDAVVVGVEAELWSAVPQSAGPAPEEAPQENIPPEPQEEILPKEATPPAPPPAPAIDQAQIAREKLREQKKAQEQQAALDKAAKEKASKDKAEQQAKADKEKADKTKQDKLAKQAEQDLQRKAEQQRKEQLQRLAGLAGGSGSGAAGPGGRDGQTSGPSANYLGKVAGAIKANITFTDTQRSSINGNPGVDIDIRALPDGSMLDPVLVKSSGNKAWDDAVLAAIAKTPRIPRDSDGRAPSRIPFTFRPND
ncbi:cell envelope integrity protein TolA [Curvibacter sp. CHRR-16]|uniref:cell envelope integrity protein TolA n=1 Tax=Curvibacter sp. CHRR-16 TaxID=2835872 RepID=UPI001BD93E45|nr:cell envelope integrity protein TolA [Curvibacter sp. CHRR-16]MBT0568963.1 cell envelope integrity protein TolA [Curvibacter sp. CHRR-16]